MKIEVQAHPGGRRAGRHPRPWSRPHTHAGRRPTQGGFSLVEVTLAMTIVALGAMATSATMLTTAEVDEEIRSRSRALEAALAKVEEVTAYDHEGDMQNLIDHYTDPSNASFVVPGLEAPTTAVAVGAVAGSNGFISVDATDPLRVRVTVMVSWRSRKGTRTIAIPTTITEVQKQ